MRVRLLLLLLFVVAVLNTSPHVVAQSNPDDERCAPFLTAAITNAVESCAALEPGEACYGHARVQAEFATAQPAGLFTRPADRAPLEVVQRLMTGPLDLDAGLWGMAALSMQAGPPTELLSPQVMVVLLGETMLARAGNTVQSTPVPVARTVTPVEVNVIGQANLRSAPGTDSAIIASASPPAIMDLDGVDPSGEWYRVVGIGDDRAWVYHTLVEAAPENAAALAALPVIGGPTAAPVEVPSAAVAMLDTGLAFSSGLEETVCAAALNAMLVYTPPDYATSLQINGVDITSSAAALFTSAVLDDGTPVMIAALLDGILRADAPGFSRLLGAPGQAFAITLNSAGAVDASAALVDFSYDSRTTNAILDGCAYFQASALLSGTVASCDFTVDFSLPAAASSNEGREPACVVTGINLANLRAGPGTSYARTGQIGAGQPMFATAYTTGSDGYRWLRLFNTSWVRGDLIAPASTCDSLPMVDAPPDE